MASYRHNKLKTAQEIFRTIENWPTAFGMRLRKQHAGLRLLNFRNGLNVVCRGGTRDWDVVHELLFAGSYDRALSYLAKLPGSPRVLDLGGNIGLFSLLAATRHPKAEIYSYEPGPPHYRLFEINQLANQKLAERIHLSKEAVAAQTGTAEWFFDDQNPGGSGFFATSGSKFKVQIRAFSEVLNSVGPVIDLAKIDIEGAEFGLIQAAPPEAWNRIQAICLELHDDPENKMKQSEFLDRMRSYGFKIEEETVCSFFLHR